MKVGNKSEWFRTYLFFDVAKPAPRINIAYTLCLTVDGMEALCGRAMFNIVSLIEEERMTMNYFAMVIK